MTRPDGTQPELARLLQEVGAVPAPAADYGAVVRAAAARGAAKRTALIGAAAVLAAALLAFGLVSLLSGEDSLDASPSPSAVSTPSEPSSEPTSEPTEEPTAEPTEEPTEQPTGEPTQEPTSEPDPEPTTDPEPAPEPTRQEPPRTQAPDPDPTTKSPTPRQTTASPKPKPYAGAGLVVTLGGPQSVADGDAVRFTVSVRDNDGKVLSAAIDFGDGTSQTLSIGSSCGRSSGTDPEPISTTTSASHTYLGQGSYTAVLRVQTGSSCRDTPRESKSDTHNVDVN